MLINCSFYQGQGPGLVVPGARARHEPQRAFQRHLRRGRHRPAWIHKHHPRNRRDIPPSIRANLQPPRQLAELDRRHPLHNFRNPAPRRASVRIRQSSAVGALPIGSVTTISDQLKSLPTSNTLSVAEMQSYAGLYGERTRQVLAVSLYKQLGPSAEAAGLAAEGPGSQRFPQ